MQGKRVNHNLCHSIGFIVNAAAANYPISVVFESALNAALSHLVLLMFLNFRKS